MDVNGSSKNYNEFESDTIVLVEATNESSIESDPSVCSDDSDSSSDSSCSSPNKDPTRTEFFNALKLKSQPKEGGSQDLNKDVLCASEFDRSETTESSDSLEPVLPSSDMKATTSEAGCMGEESALLSNNMGGGLDSQSSAENLNERTDETITCDLNENDSRNKFDVLTLTDLATKIDNAFDITRTNPLRHMSDILEPKRAAMKAAEATPVYDNLYDLIQYFGKSNESTLPCKETLEAVNPDFLFHWYTCYKDVRQSDIKHRETIRRQIKCGFAGDYLSRLLGYVHKSLDDLKKMPQNTFEEVIKVNMACVAIFSNMQEMIVFALKSLCDLQEKVLEYRQLIYEMESETVQFLDQKLVQHDTSIQGRNCGEWCIRNYYDSRNPSYRTRGPNFDNLLDLCTYLAKNEYTDDVTDNDIRRMFDCVYAHYLHMDYARAKIKRNFNLDVYNAVVCESIRAFYEALFTSATVYKKQMAIILERMAAEKQNPLAENDDETDQESLNKDLKAYLDELYKCFAEVCHKVYNIHKKFNKFRLCSHESQEAMMDFMRTRLRMPEIEHKIE